jgi:hypothetical protein
LLAVTSITNKSLRALMIPSLSRSRETA